MAANPEETLMTPERFEVARKRILDNCRRERKRIADALAKSKLDLEVFLAVEAVYKRHGKDHPLLCTGAVSERRYREEINAGEAALRGLDDEIALVEGTLPRPGDPYPEQTTLTIPATDPMTGDEYDKLCEDWGFKKKPTEPEAYVLPKYTPMKKTPDGKWRPCRPGEKEDGVLAADVPLDNKERPNKTRLLALLGKVGDPYDTVFFGQPE